MQSIAKSNWAKLPLLFLILIAMNGCATDLTGAVTQGEYCRIAKPISYDSKVDTPETVQQVERHNSQWACLCGTPPDCPK